jgi:hypothetical protein
MTMHEMVERLQETALSHAEAAIAEIPRTVRRARTLMLAVAVTVPLFAVGLVAVLWHLVR